MMKKANAIRTVRTLDTIGVMLVMDLENPLPPDLKGQMITLVATLRGCISSEYGLNIDPSESIKTPNTLSRHLTPAEAAEDINDSL